METVETKGVQVEAPRKRVQVSVDLVRPLAEYNGAGLQSSEWAVRELKVDGRKAYRCDWCSGERRYPGARGRARPRRPILECGKCKVLLCAHAVRYVEGVSGRCAKHAK